jgi:hypothetical protein
VRLYYTEATAALAASLARDAPAIRARVSTLLEAGEEIGPVAAVLIPDAYPEAEGGMPEAPAWASGFTRSGSNTVFIRASSLGKYPDRDAASVFAHELAHVEFARLTGEARLPRWFEEGACMVLARPWDLGDDASLAFAWLRGGDGMTDLERSFPAGSGAARAAYARSFSFVGWLAERGRGTAPFGRIARRVGSGMPFETAFALEYGLTPAAAEAAWRSSAGAWRRVVEIAGDTSVLWAGVLLLLVFVFIRQRLRRRRVLESWEMEEGPDPPR